MRRTDTRAAGVGRVPTVADLTIYQGDDIFVVIRVDDTTSAVDLTGYTAKAEIRSAPGGDLVAEFDAVVTSPTTVTLHLPSAESAKLTADVAWDAQVVDPSGRVTTLTYGAVTIIREVTLS